MEENILDKDNQLYLNIGCVDKDTEFLSTNGWKKISEYNNDKILEYNPINGKAFFNYPLDYIKKDCKFFNEIITRYGVNHKTSNECSFLYIMPYNKKLKMIKSYDLIEKHKNLRLGFKGKFITTFDIDVNDSKLMLSDDEIRVQIMCMADGHIRIGKRVPNRCEIKVKKSRKAERVRLLLKKANIEYKERYKWERYCFNFIPPLGEKRMTTFKNANKDQLKIIFDECFYWDGYIPGPDAGETRKYFFSKYKEDVDFIQYALASNGIRSSIMKDIEEDCRVNYRLYTCSNNMIGIVGYNKKPEFKIVPSEDGYEYAFISNTGFWVMRRQDKICIIGN